MTWLAIVIAIGLGSARLTRLVTEDTIFDRPREYLASRNWWIEKLIGCPWCVSAYTTIALVVGVAVVYGLPLPVLAYFAAWQIACLAVWVTELAFATYKNITDPQPPETIHVGTAFNQAVVWQGSGPQDEPGDRDSGVQDR